VVKIQRTTEYVSGFTSHDYSSYCPLHYGAPTLPVSTVHEVPSVTDASPKSRVSFFSPVTLVARRSSHHQRSGSVKATSRSDKTSPP